jgi:glycosidase
MKEVLRFWASKGIDGFRCDMVELVPVEFWAWALPSVKSEFPHLIFIAEVYNPSLYGRYMKEGGFDFLYDKVGLYDELRALVEGKGDANGITRIWQSQEGFGEKMLRFMENHDEQRIASDLVGKDAFRALPAMAVSVLMGKGPAMVYFGQELGEKAEGEVGFSGDDGKTTIFDYWTVPTIQSWNNGGKWDDTGLTPDQRILRNRYSQLLNFGKNSDAIRQGDFFDLQYANHQNSGYNGRSTFSFLRYTEEEKLLILNSFHTENQQLRLIVPEEAWNTLGFPINGRCRLDDLFAPEESFEFYIRTSFQSEGDPGIRLPLKAFGYRVFKMTPL